VEHTRFLGKRVSKAGINTRIFTKRIFKNTLKKQRAALNLLFYKADIQSGYPYPLFREAGM
ncbi:MAG: hypothetical protein ACI90V_005291, partial [Bacillariaceae sp.]|jgi:hypothetical protein